ncbi:Dynein assembly factor 4, axonemal [Thoreauomyces humboldtii]|nr:Dynein assembly factor 4, axonemal [Thoreauomyces humboldtii]
MPILIKDFTWTESDSHVYLNVPLKGANPKKMDVYVNDTYAKINFPPYFFELDLKEEVDSQAAVATIGNGCAKLEMPKVRVFLLLAHIKREPGIWNEITYTPSSPSALRTRREAADAQFRQRADAAREAKASARRAEERRLVQNQIDVERADREAVANLKEEEKRRAEEDMARWVAETKTQRRGDAHQVATAARQTTRQAPVEPTQKITEIFDDDDDVTGLGGIDEPPDLEDMREEEEEEDNGESGIDMDAIRARVRAQLQPPTRDIPPPRGMNHEITIKFTSRGLKPTKTARESEDLKWESRIKSMQDEHARKMAPAAEGTSLEDVNRKLRHETA